MAKVGIVMGSDSDMPVMSKAADMLEKFGIEYEMTIISAHREPDVFFEYAKTAEEKGFKVIIAGAGMAAHLPGMCAAIFPMPVIGIPMHTTSLGGRDSLYSIVQMPSGIPVATVAINGGANAGILAAKILATSDPELLQKLKDYKEEDALHFFSHCVLSFVCIYYFFFYFSLYSIQSILYSVRFPYISFSYAGGSSAGVSCSGFSCTGFPA